MAEISRTALFGKLNKTCYEAVEGATVFCKLRGNPYVELEHWLSQLLNQQDTDIHRILRHYEVDPSRVAADLTAALDRLPRGATSISDFSAHLEESVERAWVYGSLMFKAEKVRSGHIVLGLLKTRSLRNVIAAISSEFSKISGEDLGDSFSNIIAGSPEDGTDSGPGAAGLPGESSGAMAPAQMGKQEALERFTVDLTERARTGDIDDIVGRDYETRQVVDILMRRRQNNPILTGEAGVGKTAVVEGFAHRLAKGDVPPALKDVRLLALDVTLLQAGASMKGEFEERLKQVVEEVQASPTRIILFIDEAHTLVGAGGAAGTGDAANILKPALARGTLRTIAATTWAEYKKYFEKDPALTRRFQVVQVLEPSEESCTVMLRRMAGALERHHRVELLDEAIGAAVTLSHRYIPARQLPDKAVSLLDTAAARVATAQHAIPARVEDTRRRIEALKDELEILGREQSVGADHGERAKKLAERIEVDGAKLGDLEREWELEKALVDEVLRLRGELRTFDEPQEVEPGEGEQAQNETPTTNPAHREALVAQLAEARTKLDVAQGEQPLILPSVDERAVAAVVQDWTGVPVGKMVSDQIQAVLNLAGTLSQRVIGQDHALELIATRIQTSRAGLENPTKPIGVFMLAGPSGVGKTESALALADALYGGEDNVITINMSEFQEAHTVSTLKGSPPGYVGYGEGGVLTEAVRRRPYSVVLLDEIEKAHSDVHELFFQVFDKGVMEDGEGRKIDFKNTIILLTSNVGSDLIMNMCKDPALMPDSESLANALRDPLLKVFPAALLGRIAVIPYYPLNEEMMHEITKLHLRRIQKRIEGAHDIELTYDDAVLEHVVSRCTELESGGRLIDAILTNHVVPTVGREILERMMNGMPLKAVRIGIDSGALSYAFE
ncbi:MAG: type VI secretion system ATPase TssH [Phycisphaera sp.]|nr:MAG: type VI secretion system ATPase TssH [Phycisphaera sp.]